MARKTGFQLSSETISQIKIISAQASIKEDEAVSAAINFLYHIMPKDRDARISVEDVTMVHLQCVDESEHAEQDEKKTQ